MKLCHDTLYKNHCVTIQLGG